MTHTDPVPPAAPAHRRSRLHRFAVRLLAGLVVLVCVLFALGIALQGRPIAAPDWVQNRIEQRISQELPTARVSFGEMVFVVEQGWRPRVRLRDVVIATPEGQEIISLNEFKASFAMRPLFRGQIQPHDMDVSGVFATLIRGGDGVLLSGGLGRRGLARQAATLAALVGDLDAILEAPALSALRRVSVQALTLNYEDLRVDRVWTVDGGRIRLNRDGQDLTLAADLQVLSGGAGAATIGINYASQIGQTEAEFGVHFDGVDAQDIAVQSAAFAWMDVLRAPISGSVRSGLSADAMFTPLNAALQIGAGVVQPNPQAQPIPFDAARSYFSYDPLQQVLRFDELSLVSAWVTGQVSGVAELQGANEGRLKALVAQFSLTDVIANPRAVYETPVVVEGADVDVQVTFNPFNVKIGRLQVADQNQTLMAKGEISAGQGGWRVAIDGHMDGITPERLMALWPETLKPRARNWVAQNVQQATYRNVDVAIRRGPDQPPQTYLAFEFEDAKVRYLRDMPIVTDGRGQASLINNRFVVALDRGLVTAPLGGDIEVTASSFILPDVRVRDGPPAIVRLETKSDVRAALSVLDEPPLRLMQRARLAADVAQGQARLKGTLAFPLKRGGGLAAIEYDVTGQVTDVTSTGLLRGRRITAPRMDVVVDNTRVTIEGAGAVDGIPFDGRWVQPIGAGAAKSTLRAQVALSSEALKAFNISLPPGTVAGRGQGQLAVDFERGKAPSFALSSDLRGLRMAVPQLGWRKSAQTSGLLKVNGRLGDVPKVDALELNAAGLKALGSVEMRDGGGLKRARFDRLSVGSWLNVPVDLIGQGAGRAVQVAIRGGNLDMRSAAFGADSGQGGGAGGNGGARAKPAPMLVALDRLQITDTFALTNMKGTFNTTGGLDGPFEARLNGGTAVRGTIVPQNGRTAVRLTSADAGGVLRSAGLLKQIVGGELSLTLLPVGKGGAFDGRLAVKSVRVKDAPGIAALLNAVSVVGLINELNGDGIYFEEVEADFRLTSGQLTLSKASAVGASMGLSMDGIYALNSGQLDMQGVVSPVYMLNGIGSLFTRKGEGLIGFNYRLRGDAKKPSVSVNPLSALAPGMFRDILRAPRPELPDVEGVQGTTLPPVTQTPQKDVVPDYPDR